MYIIRNTARRSQLFSREPLSFTTAKVQVLYACMNIFDIKQLYAVVHDDIEYFLSYNIRFNKQQNRINCFHDRFVVFLGNFSRFKC